MSRGMRSICILAVCLAAGAHLAQGAPVHGRKVLRTPPPPPPTTTGCMDKSAACAAWGPTSCIYGGVPQTCPCMCGVNTVTPQPPVAPPQPPVPPPQPPVTPPQPPVTPPPAPPTTGCKDDSAACAAWGPASCIYGGVPQTCPCMCSGGTTTQPPVAPPQPPVAPPQPPVTPPQPPVTPPPATGGSVSSLISAQQWETIFANRNNAACQGAATNFYNYDAFIQAAAAFPGFATSSDTATNKRELAAFLAQISHETTGGWATAPGGPYAWGLCYTTEGGTATPQTAPYCAATAEYPCAAGKTYIGRGPMQLSWNYNYIQAGRAIGFDGLNNPEIVATDPVIAFKTAIWFWMTPQGAKPSCNAVMTGRYVATAADATAGRAVGYGLITNIINGGIECGKGSITPQEADRIGFFQRYTQIMGVSTGDNLNCANQKDYNSVPGTVTPPPTPSPQPPAAQPPAAQPPAAQPPSGTGGSVSSLISAQQWETIFANRNDAACQGAATNFYNYNAFIQAAAAFPGFATSSDTATNKRELAAFLAQISHETTGGWATAPGGPYAWGLCYTTEGGFNPQTAPYCAATAEYPCAAGKTYIGRGPMQLSWNYNYIQAGRAIGFDGLNNPEIVATDPVIAFKAAIWFWMTPQGAKPSCNAVMTGRYVATAADATAGRAVGYGLITNIINGGIECGKGSITPQEADRIGFFQRYTQIMGVSTGDNLNCANQRSY